MGWKKIEWKRGMEDGKEDTDGNLNGDRVMIEMKMGWDGS